jgi:hypothetical protein
LNTVETNIRLLAKANDQLPPLLKTYENLTNTRNKEDIICWSKLEEDAIQKRGDTLEIYEVKAEKGTTDEP